ncbi:MULTISPECIES: hypothetical protein [unclassified Halobacteriovorax]|uniref:hypothetical protein n=1 Tax=unclassified Halobacteriovorax TaxID=2639665 RepID=UPI00399AA37F
MSQLIYNTSKRIDSPVYLTEKSLIDLDETLEKLEDKIKLTLTDIKKNLPSEESYRNENIKYIKQISAEYDGFTAEYKKVEDIINSLDSAKAPISIQVKIRITEGSGYGDLISIDFKNKSYYKDLSISVDQQLSNYREYYELLLNWLDKQKPPKHIVIWKYISQYGFWFFWIFYAYIIYKTSTGTIEVPSDLSNQIQVAVNEGNLSSKEMMKLLLRIGSGESLVKEIPKESTGLGITFYLSALLISILFLFSPKESYVAIKNNKTRYWWRTKINKALLITFPLSIISYIGSVLYSKIM